MNLQVFGIGDKEKAVFLKLNKVCDGNVELIICDNNGNRVNKGSILTITKEGNLRCNSHVTDELGFNLDNNKRINLI